MTLSDGSRMTFEANQAKESLKRSLSTRVSAGGNF